jgi:predicted nucleotidyltransferase
MKGLDQIPLKPNDRRAIESAVRVLRGQFPVEQVVLYGSKATGTDDAESDIDLLVLTSRQLNWRERSQIVDALFDLQLELGVVISPLIISSHEWSQGRYTVLSIHDEIERYGIAA